MRLVVVELAFVGLVVLGVVSEFVDTVLDGVDVESANKNSFNISCDSYMIDKVLTVSWVSVGLPIASVSIVGLDSVFIVGFVDSSNNVALKSL